MAFTAIPSTWYAVGKALKAQLFGTVVSNLTDLDTRVTSLATASAPIIVFNPTVLNATSATSFTGLDLYVAPAAFTVTNVSLQIFTKGAVSSGTLAIDIKKSSTLGGAYTTILTTAPSINFATAADYDTSTGVLNAAVQAVTAGQYLRLDITSLPTTPVGKFRILVYGTAT